MRPALDALGADDDVGEAGVAPERGELRVVRPPPLSVSLGVAAAALAAVRARLRGGMFGVEKPRRLASLLVQLLSLLRSKRYRKQDSSTC